MPYLGGRRPKKRKFGADMCDEREENDSDEPRDPAVDEDVLNENMPENVMPDSVNGKVRKPDVNCLTDSHENNIATENVNSTQITPVAKSAGDGKNKIIVKGRDEISGFRFVDVNLLVSFIARFPCPSCSKAHLGYSDPRLIDVTEETVGQATTLEFTCGACESKLLFTNSAKAGPNFEVNSRFAASVFSVGNDYGKAKQLCAKMKMPTPLQFKSWMNKPLAACPNSISGVTQNVTK